MKLAYTCGLPARKMKRAAIARTASNVSGADTLATSDATARWRYHAMNIAPTIRLDGSSTVCSSAPTRSTTREIQRCSHDSIGRLDTLHWEYNRRRSLVHSCCACARTCAVRVSRGAVTVDGMRRCITIRTSFRTETQHSSHCIALHSITLQRLTRHSEHIAHCSAHYTTTTTLTRYNQRRTSITRRSLL